MVLESHHTVLIRDSFALFEEFSQAAQGWNLDFYQLDSSRGRFFLEQLAGTDAMVSRAYFPTRFLQRGCATPGYRTVSILSSGDYFEAWRWSGEAVTRNSLLVMPVGGEFESISSPRFESIHLALSIDKLEQLARERFQLPLYQLMPDERCFCAQGGPALVMLRRLLESISTGPNRLECRHRLSPELEDELAYLVLACLEQKGGESPRGMRGKRLRALEHALRILESSPDLTRNPVNLAMEIGVSRRTLENAFRDGLGLSPAAYLKARRLSVLGRELYMNRDQSTRVADIARAHGFYHLGQLAADYRAMFGELPSVTLKRGRANIT